MGFNYTWKGTTAVWAAAANWNKSGGPIKYPGQTPGDTAVIDAIGAYSVEYNTTGITIASLTINDSGAILYFDASKTLSVSGLTSLDAGRINVLNSGATLSTGTLTAA